MFDPGLVDSVNRQRCAVYVRKRATFTQYWSRHVTLDDLDLDLQGQADMRVQLVIENHGVLV